MATTVLDVARDSQLQEQAMIAFGAEREAGGAISRACETQSAFLLPTKSPASVCTTRPTGCTANGLQHSRWFFETIPLCIFAASCMAGKGARKRAQDWQDGLVTIGK